MASEPTKEDAAKLFDNPQELEKVLYAMTQPDNNSLREATLLLGLFMEEPKSIMPLVQQLEKSQKEEVRQVAAIYLREQIEVFWKKIPDNIKDNLKKFLIEKLFSSKTKPERLAVAAATTSVAKFVFVKNQWPELLQALERAASPDAPKDLREAGYIVWRNILQFCGGSLKPNFGKILGILEVGLKESEHAKVQVESVKAVGAMVEFLENTKEVSIVEGMIPLMVSVIEQCLNKSDEDNVIEGMEVFTDLVESQVPILSKHGVELTKFMLKIAYAKNKLPLVVRKQAVNYMTWMCKSKPKTVVKHEFVQPFLALCINLVMESKEMEEDFQQRMQADLNREENKETKDEGPDFVSPLGIACDLLDEVFLNIPSESCFPLAVKAIQQLLKDTEAQKRKTAYVMMAMMTEGCDQIISKGDNLSIMVKACLNGINDSDAIVRKCSLEALTQFSTHISDEMVKYHKMVLPEIFKIFERTEEDIRVKERALSTIEMFIDCLDDFTREQSDFNVEDYLQPLMNTIGNCLKSKNRELQVQAVATLASTAAGAGSSFVKYLPQVLQLLEQLLSIDDPEQIELRSEATQCLGAVAKAAGKEQYGPHLLKYHKFVLDGLEKWDSSSIRESSFMYFSDLAALMGSDLLKLESFEDMLYTCIMTMADDDGLIVELPDDGFAAGVPKGFLDAQDALAAREAENEDTKELTEYDDAQLQKLIEDAVADEDDEEIDEEELVAQAVGQMKNVKLQVTTGFMEEKAAAIHCVTQFMKECGFAFLQYIEDCWEQIVYLWDYPHSLVKLALCNCVHEMLLLIARHALRSVETAVQESDGSVRYNWKQGDDSIEYEENLQQWINNIFPLYIQAIHDEEDKDTLSAMIDNFSEELRVLGPTAVKSHMENLSGAINNFLQEKVACHASSDLANEDTKDVVTKHKFVTDTIAELLGVLAELWGEKFMPIFEKLFPNILRWGHPSRHPHDKAMAVGCIADVASRLVEAGDSLMAPFADTGYKLALQVAQVNDTNARQNALYCIGSLFLTAGQQANMEHSQNCLRCVNTYMKFPRDGTRGEQLIRDNAVSCLGKMIQAETDALPVKELILPFLQGLPMTADNSENYWVYRVIVYLIKNESELVKPYIAECLGLLSNSLVNSKVDDSTKNEVASCLRVLCENKAIQEIVESKLAPQQQQVIMRCCQPPNTETSGGDN